MPAPELQCSRCGRARALPPVPGQPGLVDITGADGWTIPPVLCPACSMPDLTDAELAAMEGRDRLFGQGRIVGEAAADRRHLLSALRASRAEVALLRPLAGALRCILRSPSHLSTADEERAVDALLAYERR